MDNKLLSLFKRYSSVLKQKIAEKYVAKSSISDSPTITEKGTHVLDAIEKNVSVEGTLANQIDSVSNRVQNIKVRASSSLKQAIIGRGGGSNESYSEIKFEISDTEHYLFRVHDDTDQLVVWHFIDEAYEQVWAWRSVLQANKISNSAAVTEKGKYVLDAVEKNASISGTLANQIALLKTSLGANDKAVTNITLPNTIQYGSDTVAQYCVINNICYVSLWLRSVISLDTVNYRTLIEGLPSAKMQTSFSFIAENTQQGGLGIVSGSNLVLYRLPTTYTDNVAINVSYPVS